MGGAGSWSITWRSASSWNWSLSSWCVTWVVVGTGTGVSHGSCRNWGWSFGVSHGSPPLPPFHLPPPLLSKFGTAADSTEEAIQAAVMTLVNFILL